MLSPYSEAQLLGRFCNFLKKSPNFGTPYCTVYSVHCADLEVRRHSVSGHPEKTSARFWQFLTPAPLSALTLQTPQGSLESASLGQNLYYVVNLLRDSGHLISRFLDEKLVKLKIINYNVNLYFLES